MFDYKFRNTLVMRAILDSKQTCLLHDQEPAYKYIDGSDLNLVIALVTNV